MRSKHLFGVSAAIAAMAIAGEASAALTPTGYGQSRQYTVAPLVTGVPSSNGIGAVGVTLGQQLPTGAVPLWVADFGNGFLYQLHDSPGTIPFQPSRSADYGMAGPYGLATLRLADGFHYYMAQQAAGEIIEFAPSGNMLRVVSVIAGATGIVPFPPGACPSTHCNHLFVSAQSGSTAVFELDPATGVSTPFTRITLVPAGLAWSSDGSTLYVVNRSNGATGPGGIFTFDTSGNSVTNPIPAFGAGPGWDRNWNGHPRWMPLREHERRQCLRDHVAGHEQLQWRGLQSVHANCAHCERPTRRLSRR